MLRLTLLKMQDVLPKPLSFTGIHTETPSHMLTLFLTLNIKLWLNMLSDLWLFGPFLF